ncbi:alpha/beta fold hydrolase [Methanosarcina sp. T3]|uniref:alpha/beta fold hydrolase n=1 Tax=Methanosarcina sp. T3 TaxID=3439062 RepID=UPI003F830692
MTAGYADFGDGRLYYEIEGNGEVLVFIHAGFVDSRMWDGQWEAFTQHYRALRFDMRGLGKSDPVTGPVSRRQSVPPASGTRDRTRTSIGLLSGGRNSYRLYSQAP